MFPTKAETITIFVSCLYVLRCGQIHVTRPSLPTRMRVTMESDSTFRKKSLRNMLNQGAELRIRGAALVAESPVDAGRAPVIGSG